ncbi:CopG family transcriptional regulator [Vallitalea guaymasensis]|uniref:CopG family transcriptional regulator n=1 Tax=Vallitalea guaymasensis TaxID=1185412 RepID=A0A8J8SAT4_9FIRM|nr:CopG family transcriptional regulator [Vallitalea guaymasensis]QUH28043.1 CopG family transcriptional regulator [Vallitalea guaymasensis]
MPKKMGRPLSDNPKDKAIRIRVDKDTLDRLDWCAVKLNSNRSDVIRKGIDRIADELKDK